MDPSGIGIPDRTKTPLLAAEELARPHSAKPSRATTIAERVAVNSIHLSSAAIARFAVILDNVGAEVGQGVLGSASISYIAGWKSHSFKPTAIRAVSMEQSTDNAIGGAAWGFVLAGPLGAAVGAIVGRGPQVSFEIDTEQGRTLRCVARRDDYLVVKRRVDRIIGFWAKQSARKAARTPGEPVGWKLVLNLGLAVGLIFLPPLFALFLLRKGTSTKARVVGGGWTVIWLITMFGGDKAPSPAAPTATTPPPTIEPAKPKSAPPLVRAEPDRSEVTSSRSLPMPFEACKEWIVQTADQIGSAPVTLVDSRDVRIVRFQADNGSVLVTCSRKDRKAVIQAPWWSRWPRPPHAEFQGPARGARFALEDWATRGSRTPSTRVALGVKR